MFKIGNSWDIQLQQEFKKTYMVQLLQWLTLMYQNRNILPAQKDIFRALQLTSYEKVKVVIVGQDPYPGLDKKGVYHAHGLSFSSQSRHQVPASLKNIFRELEMDLGHKPPLSADLTGWAKQGVLLLNTVLTVEAGKANSHKDKGWEILTDFIIKQLGNNDMPMVFILWGNLAQKKEKLIQGKKKCIIKSPHPSPFSAGRGFFGSKPFSRTNDFLKAHGLSAIDWSSSHVFMDC